jgi:hypothetical protein
MAGGQVRIDQMYAFVALDPEDDTEGIVAFLAPGSGWMPMVGADMQRIDQLRPFARQQAKALGVRIRLLRFTDREEIEVIEP